jgi:ABC-type transporter Mla maintaining outer membrane lipid asymmetry permease subunit MlaE
MTMCFLILALLALAPPMFATYLEQLLEVSYGALALIFLASISLALALSPQLATAFGDELAAEYSVAYLAH